MVTSLQDAWKKVIFTSDGPGKRLEDYADRDLSYDASIAVHFLDPGTKQVFEQKRALVCTVCQVQTHHSWLLLLKTSQAKPETHADKKRPPKRFSHLADLTRHLKNKHNRYLW